MGKTYESQPLLTELNQLTARQTDAAKHAKRTREILFKATLSFASATRARLADIEGYQAQIMLKQLNSLEKTVVAAYEVGSKEQLLKGSKQLIHLAKTLVSLDPFEVEAFVENAKVA